MGQSVLVFISHSSEDKSELVEPIIRDLEASYINIWLDKKKIIPGDNLRKSIFKDGLDKADIVLIFFTQQSLKSSWVDREIKHVLREENKKGNNANLNKIISIFDSEESYIEISEKYPELTDDLLHLMPKNYNKIHLSQLITAIWSKYFSLQGGNIETQRQLLEKEKEIFQKSKEIHKLQTEIEKLKSTKDKELSPENRKELEIAWIETNRYIHFCKNQDARITDKRIELQAYISQRESFLPEIVTDIVNNILAIDQPKENIQELDGFRNELIKFYREKLLNV